MKLHKEIGVVFGVTNTERDKLTFPIRIPILKGLSGWRIPLGNKNETPLFSSISTLE